MLFSSVQAPHRVGWAALLLPALAAANNLNCEDISAQSVRWNLKELGGPHSLSSVQEHYMQKMNTTYTVDICQPLKTGPKNKDCRSGTHVCALQRPVDSNDTEHPNIIEIAGNYKLFDGSSMRVEYTRLKSSDSNSDTEKDGLRMKIGGGKVEGITQYAIIEFLCSKDGVEERRRRRRDADDDAGEGGDGGDGNKGEEKLEETDDGHGGKISFVSYKNEESEKGKTEGILRLNWETKFGCEGAAENMPTETKGGWGFFSWFFLIIFLIFAIYVVFGSWLNYNRYGARGWDLVPHGDTVRDMPYILRDWVRKVVDTVQGGGSRGGYSAV